MEKEEASWVAAAEAHFAAIAPPAELSAVHRMDAFAAGLAEEGDFESQSEPNGFVVAAVVVVVLFFFFWSFFLFQGVSYPPLTSGAPKSTTLCTLYTLTAASTFLISSYTCSSESIGPSWKHPSSVRTPKLSLSQLKRGKGARTALSETTLTLCDRYSM
jgi:hypothetical protein